MSNPFTNILLAYQLEGYHALRFLRVVYGSPFIFARSHRQRLVWTMKVQILAFGMVTLWIASMAFAVLILGAISIGTIMESFDDAHVPESPFITGPFFLPVGLIVASTISLLLLPIYAVIIHTLLLPLDWAARARIIARARRIRDSWQDTIVIGIAGSYGKTSQRVILEHVLSPFFRVLATQGTLNTPIGISRTIGERGTEIWTERTSFSAVPEVFIAEMGEHYPGDIDELTRLIRPDIGIITGITEQHLERFGNIDAIIDTIFELPRGMAKNFPHHCEEVRQSNLPEKEIASLHSQ